MLNFIPALFLLLASGPFGPSSRDALARIEVPAQKALVIQLARELERAGLTAAQAVLVMASCEDKPTESAVFDEGARVSVEDRPSVVRAGFLCSARPRDGPSL